MTRADERFGRADDGNDAGDLLVGEQTRREGREGRGKMYIYTERERQRADRPPARGSDV